MEAFRVSHLLENQEAEYFLEADQEVSVKDLCPVVYVHQLGSVSQSFNAFQSQHYSLEIKCSNPWSIGNIFTQSTTQNFIIPCEFI